tara:strand:- start:343 stop:450 length:108 start_codon:yes stop_codon:yes gene_type:complete
MISIEENELKYPLTITIPENYWTYSINNSEENEEE